MTSVRIRPRFRKEVNKSIESICDEVRNALADPDAKCEGIVKQESIILKVLEKDRHYWSPQLSIVLDKEGDDKTFLTGLYGPSPKVWMNFVFGYAFLGLAFFFLGIMGGSRYMVSQDSTLLWGLPVLGLGLIAMYVIAQLGQKKGAKQTYQLHFFIENILEESVDIE